MAGIEDLLRRRAELLQEIDREIQLSHTREATLLFTDIVGSTRFYAKWGDIAGRQMVQAHNDLLFPIIAEHGGRVIKTIGDSIMAVFNEPNSALAATIAMQRAISVKVLGAGEEFRFQVRMGLHHGTVVVEDADLFGDVVNTAARVQSLAMAGEILVSGPIHDRAKESGAPLIHVGSELLRGREQAIELYSVDWKGLGQKAIQDDWRHRKARPSGSQTGVARPPVHLGAPPDLRAEVARQETFPARGNPYLNRVMIPNPDAFIGRRAILRRLFERFGGDRPQSVSLVGERRIGKSSLLNHIRSPRSRTGLLKCPDTCHFVYLDFQQATVGGPERLLALMVDGLRRQAGMLIEGLADFDCLRSVGEVLQDGGCRLIFLLDEFEAVTREKSLGADFYGYLRSLANGFPIAFVTASGSPLKELCATKAIADSPFFNIFTTIQVGAFSEEEARSLIEGPSAARGIPLGALADSILEMAGHMPFFLQIACCSWYEHLEEEAMDALSHVWKPAPAGVLSSFREEASAHFEFILESLDDEEAALIAKAASTGGIDMDDGPSAEALLRKGYLVERGGSLVPFGGEFARFVRNLARRGPRG